LPDGAAAGHHLLLGQAKLLDISRQHQAAPTKWRYVLSLLSLLLLLLLLPTTSDEKKEKVLSILVCWEGLAVQSTTTQPAHVLRQQRHPGRPSAEVGS